MVAELAHAHFQIQGGSQAGHIDSTDADQLSLQVIDIPSTDEARRQQQQADQQRRCRNLDQDSPVHRGRFFSLTGIAPLFSFIVSRETPYPKMRGEPP